MVPDVGFQRRNIEVTDQHGLPRSQLVCLDPLRQLVKKVQLVSELLVHFTIRNIPARGNIEIMDIYCCTKCFFIHRHTHVARIIQLTKFPAMDIGKWKSRYCRYAMVSLLPMQRDVLISQLAEPALWKFGIPALYFLQTQDVRRMQLDEFFDKPEILAGQN